MRLSDAFAGAYGLLLSSVSAYHYEQPFNFCFGGSSYGKAPETTLRSIATDKYCGRFGPVASACPFEIKERAMLKLPSAAMPRHGRCRLYLDCGVIGCTVLK